MFAEHALRVDVNVDTKEVAAILNVVLESMVLTVRILAKVVYVKHVISGMGHVQTKVAVNLDGNPGCPCVIQYVMTGIMATVLLNATVVTE